MNKTQQAYIQNQDKFRKIVWEYNISPTDFFEVIEGKKTSKFNQDWAISRVIENVNYYDAMKLIGLDLLKKRWENVKKHLFQESIRKGYELVLQKYALSTAR